MARILYPIDKVRKIESLFLGGTIDQGKSEEWQAKIIDALKDEDLTIYNPRRLNWDSTWEQKEENENFRDQVNWELTCLEKSDLVIMYFAPNSKSPISLLEFGMFYKKMIVCCPEGFWRKGNVDIVCRKYNVPKVESLKELIDEIKFIIKTDNI